MLVFVSDLHMMDGSVGHFNLPASAFKLFFRNVADQASRVPTDDVTIIFLGDIFDLITTDVWFKRYPDVRPWMTGVTLNDATAMLNSIANENVDTFNLLSGSLKDEFGFKKEPKRIYIPGNHDRLCNVHPPLRHKVRQLLGMPHDLLNRPFSHVYISARYGVFARHGHEWDEHNFENTARGKPGRFNAFPDASYDVTPIGDFLTVEQECRLPELVESMLPDKLRPQARLIRERLGSIYDIRPKGAILPWLQYQVRANSELKPVAGSAARRIAWEVLNHPFYRKWAMSHVTDRTGTIMMMTLLGLLVTCCGLNIPSVLLNFADSKEGRDQDKTAVDGALKDFARLDRHRRLRNRIRYVVSGHTHNPVQLPISVIPNGTTTIDRFYINTGTWRPAVARNISGGRFSQWKNLTYTIVYSAREKPSEQSLAEFPTFETWTGTLKD
jgi:UDP-2,3-diacylglucosamine pyrophosphatase LpxH